MEWEIKNTQLIATLGVTRRGRGEMKGALEMRSLNKCMDSKKEEEGEIKKRVCILLHSVSFSLVFIAAIISQWGLSTVLASR